jgi:hypothetical protein
MGKATLANVSRSLYSNAHTFGITGFSASGSPFGLEIQKT